MTTTPEQIKTIEGMRDNPNRYFGDHFTDETVDKFQAALTAILEELRESRELLEAAGQICSLETRGGVELWTVRCGTYRDNDVGWTSDVNGQQITEWHERALDAFAEVKKRENL